MCDLLARCLLPVISHVFSSLFLHLSFLFCPLPDPLDPFDNATRTIIPINNLPFGYVKNSFGCASLCRCSLLLLLLLSTLWNLRQPPGATLPTAAAALTTTTTSTIVQHRQQAPQTVGAPVATSPSRAASLHLSLHPLFHSPSRSFPHSI